MSQNSCSISCKIFKVCLIILGHYLCIKGLNSICRKASQKLHALSRTAKYIPEDKKRMLF